MHHKVRIYVVLYSTFRFSYLLLQIIFLTVGGFFYHWLGSQGVSPIASLAKPLWLLLHCYKIFWGRRTLQFSTTGHLISVHDFFSPSPIMLFVCPTHGKVPPSSTTDEIPVSVAWKGFQSGQWEDIGESQPAAWRRVCTYPPPHPQPVVSNAIGLLARATGECRRNPACSTEKTKSPCNYKVL